MHVAQLGPEHVPAYRSLMLEAYAAHPDAFTSTAAERAALPLGWWHARVTGDGAAAFGAFDAAALVGAVALAPELREKTRHKVTLVGMYVAPSARGRGAGRALVDAVVAEARRRPGVRVVQLTVSAQNTAASALYAACGFAEFGVEPLALRVGDAWVAKRHLWRDLGAGLPRP